MGIHAKYADLEMGRYRFDRYQQACRKLGYGDGSITEAVWLGCEPDAQKSMLKQMEDAMVAHERAQHELATRGLEWGAF